MSDKLFEQNGTNASSDSHQSPQSAQPIPSKPLMEFNTDANQLILAFHADSISE